MDLCFSLLLGAEVLLRVPSPVTLAWRHSVEQLRIEEDYRADAAGVQLSEVRVEGPGAGIDLPAEARFDGRWWRHRPALAAQPRIVLAHSGHVAGYTLCTADAACRPLAPWLGVTDRPLVLHVCDTAPRAEGRAPPGTRRAQPDAPT